MIRARRIKKLENSSVGYESDVVSFSVDEESYYDDCGSLLLLTLKRNPIDEKQVWDSKALKIQIPHIELIRPVWRGEQQIQQG